MLWNTSWCRCRPAAQQARLISHRSDTAGRARADHARPFRSCPCRPRRCAAAVAETLDVMPAPLWRISAGSTQAIGLEDLQSRRRDSDLPPCRPCARLGAVSRSKPAILRVVASGDYENIPIRPCARSSFVPCDVFITEATFALPVFRHGDPDEQIAKLLRSVALFPERAHLVGAYSLGKAQRVIALLRKPDADAPICTARWKASPGSAPAAGIALGGVARSRRRRSCARALVVSPSGAARRYMDPAFPDPSDGVLPAVVAHAAARARQHGVAFPFGRFAKSSADSNSLTAIIAWTDAGKIGAATAGRFTGALVRHAWIEGATPRHCRLWRRAKFSLHKGAEQRNGEQE